MDILNFTKMHGAGNDFIVIEDMENIYENPMALAKKLCHRNFGIGADGVIFVRNSHLADIQMVIINSDGSLASMCGNGLRCFVKYVFDKKIVTGDHITVETGDGIKKCYIEEENGKAKYIKVNMGTYTFDPELIPVKGEKEIIDTTIVANGKKYKINTLFLGVPHTVILGRLDNFQILEGKYIEEHEMFPHKTNVNFCEVISRDEINVKTWERGAGATMACGTGSCASVVVCNRLGKVDSKVKVNVPGGQLIIEITPEGVFMLGRAETTFTGVIEI